jgi:hypothetical protein
LLYPGQFKFFHDFTHTQNQIFFCCLEAKMFKNQIISKDLFMPRMRINNWGALLV